MKPKEFISQLDEEKIVAAIAVAEKKTSGEIRVYISDKKREDPLAFAQKRFVKLGMTKTRQRNGVLIYLAPAARKFAVVGDSGIHEKCGQTFWHETRDAMTDLLKQQLYTEAIVTAVNKIGVLLARHFPFRPDDKDELPNKIIRD
ncbi:MAG: TPM domain-containing protein [Verrucomicrobiota bacterium]|nr:TPM domain-containing protein [Verrucomicrobiota bacterium]